MKSVILVYMLYIDQAVGQFGKRLAWIIAVMGGPVEHCVQVFAMVEADCFLDVGYFPPTDTGSLCLAVDSTRTAVGLFRLLVRRSVTHCQMNSEIRRVMSTASNSCLKQYCSAFTSVTIALEVNFDVMCSINSCFTYLLTLLTYLLSSFLCIFA